MLKAKEALQGQTVPAIVPVAVQHVAILVALAHRVVHLADSTNTR